MKLARIEPLIPGTQNGTRQRVRLRLPGGPYRLEAVTRIEALKQRSIQRFTSDGQFRRIVDPVADFRVGMQCRHGDRIGRVRGATGKCGGGGESERAAYDCVTTGGLGLNGTQRLLWGKC